MLNEPSPLPDNWMPICETCGKPMRLVDVRAKAAALGLRLPDNQEQYVIECCGYTMRIDDPEMDEKAIRNLKKYYEQSEQPQ